MLSSFGHHTCRDFGNNRTCLRDSLTRATPQVSPSISVDVVVECVKGVSFNLNFTKAPAGLVATCMTAVFYPTLRKMVSVTKSVHKSFCISYAHFITSMTRIFKNALSLWKSRFHTSFPIALPSITGTGLQCMVS